MFLALPESAVTVMDDTRSQNAVGKHLLRERPLGQLEAWRPSSAPLPCRLTGLRTGSWMRRWIPGAVPAPPDA